MDTYWKGKTPIKCEMCGGRFKRFFADGRTEFRSRALMCLHCLDQVGTGLGQGRGQLYMKVGKDKWKKVAG